MIPPLYKNIKKIRELKNITREHIAHDLGMSSSGYSKIERGEVDLTITKIISIANILDVSLEFIIDFNVDKILENKKNNF